MTANRTKLEVEGVKLVFVTAVRRLSGGFVLAACLGIAACTGPNQYSSPLCQPGATAFDPRLIGVWVGAETAALRIVAVGTASAAEKQLIISFHTASEPGLSLYAHACELDGKVYYSAKPDLASYFRSYRDVNVEPGHLLAAVEFATDNEVFVWMSYPAQVDDAFAGSHVAFTNYGGYQFIHVAPDQLRAALASHPLRLLNYRVGPFLRLDTTSRKMQALAWSIDARTGCAVAMRTPFNGKELNLSMDVTWSGACVDGKASGTGIVRWSKEHFSPNLEFEGTLVAGVPQGAGRCRRTNSSEWKACRYDDGVRNEED